MTRIREAFEQYFHKHMEGGVIRYEDKEREADLIIGNKVFDFKLFKRSEKCILDCFTFEIQEDTEYRHHERALFQIEGFQEFQQNRAKHGKSAFGEKEQRLIRQVELAINDYVQLALTSNYRAFRYALTQYFLWLEKKLQKHSHYIIHLFRLLCGRGIVIDARRKFRNILRFRSRQLDDEDGEIHNLSLIILNFFYQSHRYFYANRLYQTSIGGPEGSSWFGAIYT